ncbi:MAG: cysteine peptidase family C39 domain-containing protein [Planctomycetota bacterium]
MDLVATALLLIYAAVVSFRLGKKYSLKSASNSSVPAACLLVLSILICWNSTYSLRWAQIIPHGSALLIANSPLTLLAGVAGLISGLRDLPPLRRNLLASSLALSAVAVVGSVVLYHHWSPISIQTAAEWDEGVCLQTHEASCAPAASVTLLNQYGIATSEREMAKRCLTSSKGTLSLAAFRGVSNALRSSPFSARAVVEEPSRFDADDLALKLPLMALVSFEDQLDRSTVASQRRRPESGFLHSGLLPMIASTLPQQPREQHAVVLTGRFPNGDWQVADPAVGRVRWSDKYFRGVWVGEGIYVLSSRQ